MFEKLNCLIFGLEEFEKVKIEIRFCEAEELSKTLIINSITEFEIVQKSIFKIKELLRLKSSNLNKAINDPSRKIKKSNVLNLLENLENIKNIYLEKNNPSNEKEKNSSKPKDNVPFSENNSSISEENVEILNTKEFKLILSNEKIPYLLIEFKNEIDYSLIKIILSIFFEEYMPEGTNVIIEEKNALIIPRKNNDNLITFQNPEVNLDQIYDKLVENKIQPKKIEKKKNNYKLEKPKKTEKKLEIINNVSEQKEKEENKDEYISVEKITEKPQKKSLKSKEESLDNLLEAINNKMSKSKEIQNLSSEKKDENTNNKEELKVEKEDVQMEIIPDEKIEIERKTKQEKLKEDIIFEKKEEKGAPLTISNNQTSNSKIKSSNTDEGFDMEDYSIYIDDKIKVYIESKSRTAYEIVITTINEEQISKLNESTFSYMIIFAKVFSQMLFEEAKPHGTNLIFDYSKNKIRIISRNENDNLKLNWELKDASDDFLEQVKTKLFSEMTKVRGYQDGQRAKGQEGQQNKGTKVERVTGEVMSSTKEERQENKDKLKETQDKTLEEKARIILESLRRIP